MIYSEETIYLFNLSSSTSRYKDDRVKLSPFLSLISHNLWLSLICVYLLYLRLFPSHRSKFFSSLVFYVTMLAISIQRSSAQPFALHYYAHVSSILLLFLSLNTHTWRLSVNSVTYRNLCAHTRSIEFRLEMFEIHLSYALINVVVHLLPTDFHPSYVWLNRSSTYIISGTNICCKFMTPHSYFFSVPSIIHSLAISSITTDNKRILNTPHCLTSLTCLVYLYF